MWTPSLRADIQELFLDAQDLVLAIAEAKQIRRARRLQEFKRMTYKIGRSLDKFLRRPATAIKSLPAPPASLQARRDPRLLGKGSGATK